MKRLKDKVIIITGGGQGIGKAGALKFAREGAVVIVIDINSKTGESVVSKIKDSGGESLFIYCDVSKIIDVKNAINEVDKKYGKLNVLYNNASVYLPSRDGKITEIDEETWDKIININLKSIFLFCKFSIPLMIKSGGGSIINTSSSAGIIGIPNNDAYTAAKGATVQLTKSMAVEYGPDGIRVNCIAPAAIDTPMMKQSNPVDSDFDEKRFLGLRTPLRRYGTSDEIANIACFLASDESSYLNGAIIVADGGITINGDLSKLKES